MASITPTEHRAHYRSIRVDEINVFYREAGDLKAPALLLLHGPPTSSHKVLDYASNVALYPKFQEYLRAKQPPLSAFWGKNDPSFQPAGAAAFERDNPQAEVHFPDTGHFALETQVYEIAAVIRDFLDRHV